MTLNQNYVMSDAAYTEGSKKKEVEEIEELANNLKQQEKRILGLKQDAIKKEDTAMKEIMRRIVENCELVVMVNDTQIDQKKLEIEIENLCNIKKEYEEELKITKAEALASVQISGIQFGSDPLDVDAEKEEVKRKGASAFQKKKENLEDKARI